MSFKLSALIKSHPRLAHAVEVFVRKQGLDIEHFVVGQATDIADNVEAALAMVQNLFPQLGEGDIDVQLSSSGKGNQSAV